MLCFGAGVGRSLQFGVTCRATNAPRLLEHPSPSLRSQRPRQAAEGCSSLPRAPGASPAVPDIFFLKGQVPGAVEGGKKWRDLGVKFIGYACDTYIFMQGAKADVESFAK